MRRVSDDERRARLARRHGLHPDHCFATVEEAARGMTALHSTDASTVHLSLRARVEGVQVEHVDTALYQARSLVKQLAMRRTVWAFPRDLVPAALGSAAPRVTGPTRAQLLRDIDRAGIAEDAQEWLDTTVAAVENLLADGTARTAKEIREALVELTGTVERSPGKAYAATTSIAPSVLTLMGAQGRIVRGRNTSHLRMSRPQWDLMEHWLGAAPDHVEPADGYAELVRRWLWTFGPGTEADLAWWLGSTKTAVRQALSDIGAVQVELGSGERAWLRADDLDAVAPVSSYAALLPTLDPTTMGWRGRTFYLDPHDAPYLFDTVGNGGTTVWLNGRVIGAWVQHSDGTVLPVLRHTLSRAERNLVETEATALTNWLDGIVITNVYKSQLMRGDPIR